MKLSALLLIIPVLAATLITTNVSGQANASINILTQNSGQVNIGGTVFVQVDIGNTGPASNIGVNKVRAQISIPIAIAHPLPNAQQTGLPPGWIITANTGSAITVCNGTDIIAVNEVRTVLIAVQGDAIGGPSTLTGVLSFGPGTGVCTGPGSLSGDITADNTSTSSIEVTTIVAPVTLTDFNARLINCEPLLYWTTETEINSDRFEIERRNLNNSDWSSIGVVTANGNTTTKSEYNYTDRNSTASSEKVLYRLKMIDQDGKFKYSEVLYVLNNCNTTKVEVYPNPVQNGRLYVSLIGASGYSEATLLSLSGQVIVKARIYNGTSYLNVSTVADGIYVLNIKDADGIDRKVKVRIQH
jgi:Secretion system C-terminal sorting domain